MYSNAEKLINSILRMPLSILENIYIPLAISIVFVLSVLIAKKIKYKDKYKDNLNIKKLIINALSVLYIAFLMQMTLLGRISKAPSEPFSDVWGEWSIFKTDKVMFVNSNPAINFVMMIPMAFIAKYFLNIKDKLLLKSVIISFLSSATIEICQIIFKLGTFQVSDLVYNTLGGLLGYGILILIEKIISYYKSKKTL